MKIFFLSILLTSCAGLQTNYDQYVLPQKDGSNLVEISDTERDLSRTRAIQIAKGYCSEKSGKSAVFDQVTTMYKGKIPEETKNVLDTVGSMGKVIGVNNAPDMAAELSKDSEYKTRIEFFCR